MAERLQLKNPVHERPRADWGSIATELFGCQIRFVQGERWIHRIIEKGDGPPLFMYHGVGGYAEPYARTLPQLARDFRVIAVDALFHGKSSKEPWDPSQRITLQAEAYVDLLHALGYESAHFEGESMGATMGVEIGMRFPETVNSLILNGFGRVKTDRTEFKTQPFKGHLFELSQKAILDPTYENIRNRLLWLVHDDASIDDESIRLRQRVWSDPEIKPALMRTFGLSGVDQRTVAPAPWSEAEMRAGWKVKNSLVLYGEFNPERGPDYGEYCADIIGAKFYEFKAVGHWPMWEAPDEYVEVLRSFLLDLA